VKNREISETSKVVLLLWIKCIKKSVLYLASRNMSLLNIPLICTVFNIGNLGTKFSFMIISLELSVMFLQNKSVKTRVALPTIYGYTYTLIKHISSKFKDLKTLS
jgi:regulator of PEP synthase PpsR (kinase-PPPase family)